MCKQAASLFNLPEQTTSLFYFRRNLDEKDYIFPDEPGGDNSGRGLSVGATCHCRN
jgi:hypothetical protein